MGGCTRESWRGLRKLKETRTCRARPCNCLSASTRQHTLRMSLQPKMASIYLTKPFFFCVQGLKLSILIKLIINVGTELDCYRLELQGRWLLQLLLLLLCFLYPYLYTFISHNALTEGALFCLSMVDGEKIYVHVEDI